MTSISPSSTNENGRRWDLHTPRGTVSCRYVVHATNGYASHLLPHLSGPNGIIPTRGQIIATRSSASSAELTDSAWVSNSAFEYWFPRPTQSPNDRPLVILGGAREVPNNFEFYETDDSVLVRNVGVGLRGFLPQIFPEKFKEGQEPEKEWVSAICSTSLEMTLCFALAGWNLDWNTWFYEDRSPFCKLFYKFNLTQQSSHEM